MPDTRDIMVIGASSGGLEVLLKFIPRLSADLPAAIFVVIHLPPNPPSILHEILQPKTRWPVRPAVNGAEVRRGVITVAVNNHHLLFAQNRIRLARGPRESRARPAIDATMRSAAVEFGPRTVGVVLTGNLDDGTAGLWAVKDRGGVAIAQSPDEAEFPSMPRNAIAHACVDHIVRMEQLPDLLFELSRQQAANPMLTNRSEALAIENRIAAGDNPLSAGILSLGAPSVNTCPHCHGVLMELSDTGPLRFRCHTGHAFSPESLLADLDRTIDDGLTAVLRSIHERQLLLDQLIHAAKLGGDEHTAQEYARQLEDASMRADEIRTLVMAGASQGPVASGA
jgi:two-component system, chemotaxis family, protein-glutamate methylesterase/glutaminase